MRRRSERFTPEGHVDDFGCWCGPEVRPVDGLMHTLVADHEAIAIGAITPGVIATDLVIRQGCPAPAPLVVNGGTYVGCQLEQDHEGAHEVRISWGVR